MVVNKPLQSSKSPKKTEKPSHLPLWCLIWCKFCIFAILRTKTVNWQWRFCKMVRPSFACFQFSNGHRESANCQSQVIQIGWLAKWRGGQQQENGHAKSGNGAGPCRHSPHRTTLDGPIKKEGSFPFCKLPIPAGANMAIKRAGNPSGIGHLNGGRHQCVGHSVSQSQFKSTNPNGDWQKPHRCQPICHIPAAAAAVGFIINGFCSTRQFRVCKCELFIAQVSVYFYFFWWDSRKRS